MGRSTRVWISLVCALTSVAAMYGYALVVRREASVAVTQALGRFDETVEIHVAVRDIAAGEELDGEAVEVRTWPAALLPAGYLGAERGLEGAVADAFIARGEPVVEKRCGTGSQRLVVPESHTALTIACGDVEAAGGAVTSGSRVDVFVVAEGTAVPLLDDALVLETSKGAASRGAGPLAWVTLAVPEDRALETLSASGSGTVHLAVPASRP